MTRHATRGTTRIGIAAAVAAAIALPGQPAYAQQSAAVQKLGADAKTLGSTLASFLLSATSLDGKLAYVQGKLDLPGKISSDLKQLDSSLSTASDLLQTVSLVPDIKTEVDAMIDGINATQQPVRDAQATADSFDTSVKPAKDSVNAIEGNVRKLMTDITSMQKALLAYVPQVDSAQQCVNGLAAGTRPSAQGDLDKAVSASSDSMVAMNAALQAMLARFNSVAQSVDAQLYPLFGPVNDVETSVNALDTNLQNAEGPLRDVGSVLDRKFGVSFPYWHPTLSHPWRIDHYAIRIGMSTIVAGAEKIESEIERVLSKALYRAAKLFGLQKLIDSLVNDANKAMSEVLSKLHLEFKVSVPGLGDFSGNLTKIGTSLQAQVPHMGIDVSPVENAVAPVQNGFAAITRLEVCAASPAPQGPPRSPPQPTPRQPQLPLPPTDTPTWPSLPRPGQIGPWSSDQGGMM